MTECIIALLAYEKALQDHNTENPYCSVNDAIKACSSERQNLTNTIAKATNLT